MNELVFFLVVGAVFLLLFLTWFLIGRPKARDEAASMKALEQIVSLAGPVSTNPEMLFDDSDYQMLRSDPQLQSLAREMRRDRRQIILLWLKLLREDVKTLWRFRRLLVRNGISVHLAEELHIATTAVFALIYLSGLRALISVVGPFALPALLRLAGHLVEATSQLCAQLLSRVPLSMRAEIERQWEAEFDAPAV